MPSAAGEAGLTSPRRKYLVHFRLTLSSRYYLAAVSGKQR